MRNTQCTALQTFMSHKKTTYLIYAYIYVSENLHSILQIQITNLNAAILDLGILESLHDMFL